MTVSINQSEIAAPLKFIKIRLKWMERQIGLSLIPRCLGHTTQRAHLLRSRSGLYVVSSLQAGVYTGDTFPQLMHILHFCGSAI